MLKRIASILLCLVFVASSALLVACAQDEETSGTSGAGGDIAGFLNEAKDWGDAKVTILGYNGEFAYHTAQIAPEEKIDEAVSDAFFERNALIEEKFGIKIEAYIPTSDQDPIGLIKNSVQAGLHEYDVIINPLNWMTSLITEDCIYDFNSIDNGYLHLDQAWWDRDLIEDLAVNDKVYFLAGDAVVEDDEATWAMFFNKDMFKTNAALSATLGDYDTIYDLVRDGKWTLDKMYEMLQTVSKTSGAEKDYVGALEADGDQWGMVAQSYDFYLFMQGCEQILVDNTGDVPVLRISEQENVTTFNNLADIMLDEQNVGVADFFSAQGGNVYQQKRQIFAAGNALFMPSQLGTVGQAVMREAEIPYGILPMPKRNELQEQYTTSIQVYHYSAIAVPVTNVENLDVTCYALEAMAYFGKQVVTPEYYDRTLTLKRFEDQESRDMLEIIFNNKIYDMGAVFNFGDASTGTLYFYTDLFLAKSTGIVSHFEKRQNVYNSGIDDFIATCYN